MVKLNYLKIEKYRSVKPGTELHFRDSLNVVLGRNGTGKTTLLNLIVQLLNWDFSKLQEESASLEYSLHTPELEVSVHFLSEKAQPPLSDILDIQPLSSDLLAMGLIAKDSRSTTTLSIDVTQAGEEPWTIHLDGATLTLTKQGQNTFSVSTEQSLLGPHTLGSIRLILSNAVQSKLAGAASRALSAIARAASPSPQRFDESLSYFDSIVETEVSVVFPPHKTAKLKPFILHDGPTSFASALETTLTKDADADELGIESTDEGQTFLHRIVGLLEFSSAKVRLQRTAKSNNPYTRIDFGKTQFAFTKKDGSVLNHSLLSYGQKRLLAFFYYLATYSTSVIADELVNGMHHEWIDACLEDLGERQAFLTSQNPLLLDYLTFESAEEVRASFVLCRTETHENREQQVWENMTTDDSEGFFQAYQVAIQHVSELLRTRGLW